MGPREYILKYSNLGDIQIVEFESYSCTYALSQAIAILNKISSATFISLEVKHD